MDENGLLEPSFADAIAAIEQCSELPPARRTHWVCSLRQIAKALGRPPESIPARWGAVALKVNQLHHAGSGVEWKTPTINRMPKRPCIGIERTMSCRYVVRR